MFKIVEKIVLGRREDIHLHDEIKNKIKRF
jgi:hypothetical protein